MVPETVGTPTTFAMNSGEAMKVITGAGRQAESRTSRVDQLLWCIPKGRAWEIFMLVNRRIVKWAGKIYKKLKQNRCKGSRWLAGVASRSPKLFVHCDTLVCVPTWQ